MLIKPDIICSTILRGRKTKKKKRKKIQYLIALAIKMLKKNCKTAIGMAEMRL